MLFLSLVVKDTNCSITNCFYIDRSQHKPGIGRYGSKPQKLQTMQFPTKAILSVIEAEFNKKFYGIEFVQSAQSLTEAE